MKNAVLSIQINEMITKICVLEKYKNTTKIINAFAFETPENTFANGQVINTDELASAILSQINKNNLNEIQNAVIVLSSPKIVSRKVSLPPMNLKKMKSVIALNASDYFPIDLTNYQITHTVLKKIKEKNGGYEVLVAAVPKQLLLSYTKLADTLNLNIQTFDFEANINRCLFEQIGVSGVTMYVSLGLMQSLATFMSDDQMILQRAIPFGVNDIVSHVINEQNLHSKTQQALQLCSDEKWMRENYDKQKFDENSQRLLSVVKRTADFFKTSFKEIDIERVILLDEGAQIEGIKQAVQELLNLKTYLLAEISGIDKILSDKNITSFATCASSLMGDVNLTYNKNSSEKRKSNKQNIITKNLSAIFFASCIAVGIVLGGASVYNYAKENTQLQKATENLNKLSYVQQTYDLYTEYQQIKNNVQTIENAAVNNNAQLKAFFEEIEQKMPTNLSMLSAACDNFGVTINVQTTTMQEAAKVLEQLRDFDSIVEISTSSITQTQNADGTNAVSFAVVCAYANVNEQQQQSGTSLQTSEIFTTDELLQEGQAQ